MGRIGDTLRVPGRGLRRGIAVATVLVLAAATGSAVSLSAPALVANLGLAGTPAVAAPAVPQPVLGPLPESAPAPTGPALSAVLDPLADAMPGRFTGTVLDPATGGVLWRRAAEAPLVPGSTTKLLTASAALLTLTPTDGFVTRVVAGVEPGTVVLVGGGDPTLTALPDGEVGTYPNPSRLVELAAEVRSAVPGPITTVLVDTGRYTGPTLAQGWLPGDVAAGYITPIEPLMLDGGRLDPAEPDGTRTAEPAAAAGAAFAELIGAAEVAEGTAPPNARAIATVTSAPFTDLVEHLIRSSDNVLGEMLARETAIARGGEPSFAGAAAEVHDALRQAGFDPTGASVADGSGLSTDDVVPAQLLGELLASAASPAEGERDTEALRPLIGGLPVAGGDGTLDDRFGPAADSAAGRGVVRAKTGTLDGVSSLAGVVIDADGRLLVFALMSNGVSPSVVRPRLDAMAAELSACGCR